MEKLLHTRQKPYYETENEQLYLGDSFRLLLKMEPESVDMILLIPVFLSNDGVTCQGGKMVSVNKGNGIREWTAAPSMPLTAGGCACAKGAEAGRYHLDFRNAP